MKTNGVKNNLGLVCITTTNEVRYKTVTRKALFALDKRAQAAKLRSLYAQNIEILKKAIAFCNARNIRLYRMTSALFPFADEAFGAEILKNEFAPALAAIGEDALKKEMRLVLHPDQFVVLSSDSDDVIANSVKILKMHASTMDLLGQPRSEWAAINIHGGKSDRAERLVRSIEALPEEIRSRITFENDEYSYSSKEIAEVCRRAKIPFVFDAHHHVCRENLDDFDHPSVAEAFFAARETWKDPANQMVHISNGRTRFGDRAHSDLIFKMPEVFRRAPWIEVEAKHKEIAIAKLQDEWLGRADDSGQ